MSHDEFVNISYKLNDLEVSELKRYFEKHIRPGSFVRAILENDLDGACAAADSRGKRLLPEYMSWLYANAPGGSWGSPGIVRVWLNEEQKI